MNILPGRAMLEAVIDGRRHKDYAEVEEITKLSEIIHANDADELSSEIGRYRPNDTVKEREQRLKLFDPVTRSILGPTYSTLNHIDRGEAPTVQFTLNDTTTKKVIQKQFERFYGEQTLIDYLCMTTKYANVIDPNMWVGFERQNKKVGGITTSEIYPVEFSGKQVYDFGLTVKGQTRYLCAGIKYMETDATGKDVLVKSLWFYGVDDLQKGYVYRAVSNDKGAIHTQIDPLDDWEQVTIMENGEAKAWLLKLTLNDAKEVPFFCPGAFRYENTNVKELLVHSAIGVIRGVIRDAFYLAMQKTKHLFPQKAEYTMPCKAHDEQNQPCVGGWYNGVHTEENKCKTCHGTGHMGIRNESEVLTMIYDPNISDLVELQKLIHYFPVDTEVSKFFVSELERQQSLIFAVTFNQNNNNPTERTATQVRFEADQINNVLSAIADRIEAGAELAYRVACQYFKKDEDSDIAVTFPKDFKVVPLDQLVAMYEQAVKANVPAHIRAAIELQMIEKQYPDDNAMRLDIIAIQSFKPFTDKSGGDIALILGERAPDDPDKVLWENWARVQNEVFAAVPVGKRFGEYPRAAQQGFVDAAVLAVAGRVKYLQSGPMNFNEPQ